MPPNTKNTRHVARFSCPGGGERRGEGGEAAEHKERAHVGTFCVLGCRESALARKSCPRGHDFHVGDEGWDRRAAEHEKDACVTCFLCLVG